MTKLLFYNTKIRKKQEFAPLKGKTVRLYTCGPTVYHYAHIGNFRTYIFEDLLRRTLQFFGFEVIQAMNLTDVDDKTIKGANAKAVPLNDFTKPFKEAFFQDLKILNIESAEHYPQATDYIQPMIAMIEKLLAKGYAYRGKDGSIYFAIQKFPHYGCLSHLNLEELKSGASERVETDEYDKEHVSDFALWKSYEADRDGMIYWESPFGKGRPGWHLECSVMATEILGETLDIHCGGVDNMFPHHENEIAQSEACSGKEFSRFWLHSEHLLVDNKKMSKSLGNFYTLRDIQDLGYTGREMRYMLLQTHYQHQLNFTFTELQAVRTALQRLDDFIFRLHGVSEEGGENDSLPAIQKALTSFKEALGDNLNISLALAALFDFVREVNTLIDQKALRKEGAKAVLQTLEKMNEVLGVLEIEKSVLEIPPAIQEIFDRRQLARKNKDFQAADHYRQEIAALGYSIEDSPKGSILKKC